VVLSAPGAVASFDDGAPRIAIGDREVSIALAAIGRDGAMREAGVARASHGDRVELTRDSLPGVIEWWRTEGRGLEHGVTIGERPAGDGSLALVLAVDGVTPRGENVIALGDVATYSGLSVLDANGATVPATMRAIDGSIHVDVDDARAVYPLVVDPIVTAFEAQLTRPGAGSNTRNGWAVAISLDGSVAIAGEPQIQPGAFNVYHRTGTSWSFVQRYAEPTGTLNSYFGRMLSLSDDGTVAAVGDNTPGNARVVAIYRLPSTTPVYIPACTPVGSGNTACNYENVDVSGDGSRVAVTQLSTGPIQNAFTTFVYSIPASGAPVREATINNIDGYLALDTTGTRLLVAWRVFTRVGTTWSPEATLATPMANPGMDLSTDATFAVVGGTGFTTPTIYQRTGTTWALVTGLGTTNGLDMVAMSADGTRVIAGSSSGGSVYVFESSGPTLWIQQGTITPPAGDAFSGILELSRDGQRAIIGSPMSTISGTIQAGAADVFTLFGGNAEACSATRPCGAGTCVDGVCCSTTCGGGANDCMACSHALTGQADGTCNPLMASVASTVTCRAVVDVCDVAEVCSPSSMACPMDAFAVTTVQCRGINGVCDVAEFCTGSAAACPNDGFSPNGTSCRVSVDVCDIAEYCNGSMAACPVDGFHNGSTLCRASAGPCDVAEVCNGSMAACPADGFTPSGVTCHFSAGVCDTTTACTGSSALCPNGLMAGTTCRAANGACDIAEACTGADPNCPPDAFEGAGTSCRVVAGPCDVAEVCTGASGACPADGFLNAATTCRATAGPCDIAEVCNGTMATCPADAHVAAGTMCHTAAGVCDSTTSCDGTNAACPPSFLHSTVVCRAAVGACDVAESCTGADPNCPHDAIEGAGTVCRASTAACDPAESCDGTSTMCPVDVTSCTAQPDMGVGHDAGATTGDAGMTTGDAGMTIGDGGAHDAGAHDGSAGDASTSGSDAATTPPMAVGSCGCRAGGSGSSGWLVLLGLFFAIRSRSGSRRA
jgi:hypothetical protein